MFTEFESLVNSNEKITKQRLQSMIEKLKKEQTNLKNDQEKENSQNQDIIKKLQQDIEQKEQQRIQLQNNNKDLIEEHQAKQQDKESQITNLKQKQQQMTDKIKNLETKTLEFDNLVKQNDLQIIQIKSMEKQLESYETKRDKDIHGTLKQKNLSDYDFTIKFESLLDLIKGVELVFNKDIEQQIHDNKMNNDAILVSCLGRHNSGKTFLISNITQRIFRQGYQYKTQGINIIYGQNQKKYIYYADVTGTNEPQNCYKELQPLREQYQNCQDGTSKQIIQEFKEKQNIINQNMPQYYKNSTASENFAQSFLQDNSEVLIMLVERLDEEQQKKIKFLTLKRKPTQKILIIHNFSSFTTKEQVEKQFQKDILSCFSIDIIGCQNKDGLLYFQQQCDDKEDKKQPVIHLVLGKEGEESGNYYNEKAFRFIENYLMGIETQSKNIINKFIDHLNSQVCKYMELPKSITPKDIQFQIKDNKIFSEKLNQMQSQIKLRDIHYDFWGDPITQLQVSPPHSIFESNDKYTIMIQCIFSQYTSIKVKIEQVPQLGKYVLFVEGKHSKSKLRNQFQEEFGIAFQSDYPNQILQQNSIKFGDVVTNRIELCGFQTRLDLDLDLQRDVKKKDGYISIIVRKIATITISEPDSDEDEYQAVVTTNSSDFQTINNQHQGQEQQINQQQFCQQQMLSDQQLQQLQEGNQSEAQIKQQADNNKVDGDSD